MLLKTFAQFSGIKHTWPVDSRVGRIAMSPSGIIPCGSVPSNGKHAPLARCSIRGAASNVTFVQLQRFLSRVPCYRPLLCYDE
jgi:hypothetical protein